MHTAQAAPAEDPSELSQVRAAALAAGSTYEALMAEHGGALVALEKVAPLLGLSAGRATHLAGRGGLPVPAFKLGSVKSPWLVHLFDVACRVDALRIAGAGRAAAP